MPKKHNRHPNVKPASTIHPSLEPSNTRRQNGNLDRSASDAPSVNELIQHLRQTQITPLNDGRLNASRSVSQRTLHPSLRTILDIPETPPPRPRANARLLGGRPFRRTPGPPPPSSWLQLQSNSGNAANARNGVSVGSDQLLYRLERLPGVMFPPKDSLQHVVMKSMATNWPWHLDYDNEFLTEIPTRLKIILMSYIASQPPISDTYSLGTTLDILFGSSETTSADESDRIIRLDLGSAIRNSFSVKSLTRRLLLPRHEGAPSSLKCDESVPASWDDDDNSIEERRESTPEISSRNLALYTSPTHRLRFPNLKYLSLAHPDPKGASWDALLNLLSHISTITHLSLAHWPRPTLTPNLINERVKHPTIQTLSFAAGGTDTYSIDENNWVEAVSILRRLSRMTYCLKWLDLEGCGEWFGALSWDGRTLLDEEPFQTLSSAWNGPWRDVESICLGPGWIPSPEIDVDVSSDSGSFVPLVASMHAPVRSARHEQTTRSDDDLGSILTKQDLRGAELAREKQRRVNEWKAYVETVRKAHEVEKHVHRIRREGAGKWVQFSFGGTGFDEKQALEKALAMIK